MENFTFFNPTRIEFGADKEQLIGQHLARHGVRKVLLCYGSERIKRDGLFDVVTQRLAEQGIAFVELGGIVSNPLLSTVREGIALGRAGQSAEAMELLDKLIAQSPSALAFYGRAMVHYNRGERDSALGDLDQAIALDPRNAQYQAVRNQLASPPPAPKR